jgi:peptide deformylase
MKLKIIQYPNPLLAEKSKKITIIDDSIKKLAQDMAETMSSYGSEHESGVALAAIQVGVPLRMTIIRDDEPEHGGYYALINPEIIKTGGEAIDTEGCMSVPKKYGQVTRYEKIKVRGLNIDGKKIEIRAEGLLARILQHEIDHMDGKLFLSHVPKDELYTLDNKGKLVK